jgi:asparagine synthase (glutamine-hydrolysing)
MSAFNTSESPGFDYETVIEAFAESVRRNLSDGLLLSGGLDTSLIAYIASKWIKPTCITVALRGAPAPDVEYARKVAEYLVLDHYIHYFGDEELNEGLRSVIALLNTFDPMEVRNSAAIYIALKAARDHGLSAIMTGDGCDEIFGGYSFLFGKPKEELEKALKKMWTNMGFSSVPIAEDLGVQVRLPFLDPQFRDFATGLDVGLKVGYEGDQVWGKLVLRKAFKNILPPELLWRPKAPIEVGTGTTILPSLFNSRISDLEFEEEKTGYLNQDKVVIRSKEHLFYYKIYRDLVGRPRAGNSSARICPDCGSNVEEKITFCRTCGAYPV